MFRCKRFFFTCKDIDVPLQAIFLHLQGRRCSVASDFCSLARASMFPLQAIFVRLHPCSPSAPPRSNLTGRRGRLHCLRMAKTVEIPDQLHEAVEKRAREEGVSVAQFISRE